MWIKLRLVQETFLILYWNKSNFGGKITYGVNSPKPTLIEVFMIWREPANQNVVTTVLTALFIKIKQYKLIPIYWNKNVQYLDIVSHIITQITRNEY